MKTVRLACLYCERTDYDGVEALPPDWTSIQQVQSYEESRENVVGSAVCDWFTHLGVCPRCEAYESAAFRDAPPTS